MSWLTIVAYFLVPSVVCAVVLLFVDRLHKRPVVCTQCGGLFERSRARLLILRCGTGQGLAWYCKRDFASWKEWAQEAGMKPDPGWRDDGGEVYEWKLGWPPAPGIIPPPPPNETNRASNARRNGAL